MRVRGSLLFAGGIASVLASVAAGYWWFLAQGPISRAPVAESAVATRPADNKQMPSESRQRKPGASASATVAGTNGTVQFRAGGQPWRPLRAGEELRVGTNVRTMAGGRAELRYGSDIKIKVFPNTSFDLAPGEARNKRLTLREGLLVADVPEASGDKGVAIGTAGSDAVARSKQGRLHVLADGRGGLQAAVSRGEASVSGAGKAVTLRQGTQTRVAPDAPPEAPKAIPKSLFLKVRWPETETRARRQTVRGQTVPGARVRVGNRVLMADETGRFEAAVELSEGANRIPISTLDVLGRQKRAASPPIEVDTRPPEHQVETGPELWQ